MVLDQVGQFMMPLRPSFKQGFKILIKPSSESIKTHYRKLADICDDHKTASSKALIAKLNPIIRGWANYRHFNLELRQVFLTITKFQQKNFSILILNNYTYQP